MYGWLALCLGLVAFGLGSAAGALAACAARVSLGARARPGAAAGLLLWLRFLPTTSGLAAALLVFLPAWLVYEPRQTSEPLTLSLLVATVTVAAWLLCGMARGAAAWWGSHRLARRWRRLGQPIEIAGGRLPAVRIADPFPVVAVVGLLRPRLFVAEQVLGACDAAELSAVVAHESAHVAARDNLKALLLRCCCDWLSLLPAGRRLEQAWFTAVERKADVAASSQAGSVELASALVKVARLARGGALRLPASALHEGGDVTSRVKDLLSPRMEDAGRAPGIGVWAMALLPLLAAAAALFDARALAWVHRLAETAVRF